jgi:hypothetical protein
VHILHYIERRPLTIHIQGSKNSKLVFGEDLSGTGKLGRFQKYKHGEQQMRA